MKQKTSISERLCVIFEFLILIKSFLEKFQKLFMVIIPSVTSLFAIIALNNYNYLLLLLKN